MSNIDIDKLNALLQSGDEKKIAHYLDNHRLKICDNKVVAMDQKEVKDQVEYWDRRQLVKKINLNS